MPLSDLVLTLQSKFSLPLIMDQLSPSILLNLTHLAGYLDQHSIPAILERAHYLHPSTNKVSAVPGISSSGVLINPVLYIQHSLVQFMLFKQKLHWVANNDTPKNSPVKTSYIYGALFCIGNSEVFAVSVDLPFIAANGSHQVSLHHPL